jgi:hypothetical protein
VSAARELHRQLLQEVILSFQPASEMEGYHQFMAQAMTKHPEAEVADILAELQTAATGGFIATVVFRHVLRHFEKTLQHSIDQLVRIIPATHRKWFPDEIVAALLPLGEVNAQMRRVNEQSALILLDPRLLTLFECTSLAIVSQIDFGDGPARDSSRVASAVHEVITNWMAGDPPVAEFEELTELQWAFGSMMTRRALDFTIAHELGHLVANEWPGHAELSLPVDLTEPEWQFERTAVTPEWTRELWSDSIACWLLSHSALDAMLDGDDRRETLAPTFAGAALVMALADIAEEAHAATPVTEVSDGKSRRLVWDQTTSHPAARLRGIEIDRFLSSWMGACPEAEEMSIFTRVHLARLWRAGRAS